MSPVPDPSQDHKENDFYDSNYEIQGPGIIGTGSSSEDDDASGNEYAEYQPLPQGPDNLEDEAVDYNSLEGLLSALNTNGPNEVAVEGDSETIEAGTTNGRESQTCTKDQCHESDGAGVNAGGTTPHSLLRDSKADRKKEYEAEQALIWNSKNKANEIVIDETKEEEIKSVMSRITLPNSAIPPWAKELSEEDWKSQISTRIFGNNSSNDGER